VAELVLYFAIPHADAMDTQYLAPVKATTTTQEASRLPSNALSHSHPMPT
jgi:hypothetical protein